MRSDDAWKRYAAAEDGAIRKHARGKIRIALAYPNRYAVGMANLGLHVVYGLLNRYEDVVCERVFLPENDELAVGRRLGDQVSPTEDVPGGAPERRLPQPGRELGLEQPRERGFADADGAFDGDKGIGQGSSSPEGFEIDDSTGEGIRQSRRGKASS